MCILMQLLTGRSLAWGVDFAVQPRNEAYKNSAKIIQKFTVREESGRAIAPLYTPLIQT